MKRLATLVLAAAALALGGTSALAADGGATVEKDLPVSFVMTSADCANLPPGTTIVGSGTRTSITTVRTDSNGVTTISNNTHANGTATDQDGNTYVFNYTNDFRISNADDPGVFSGRMTDAFSLAGSGPARLNNGFQAIYTTDGVTDTIEELNSRGNPLEGCDPI